MFKMFEVHTMKKKLAEVEVYLEQALDFEHPVIRQYALDTLHAGGRTSAADLEHSDCRYFGK